MLQHLDIASRIIAVCHTTGMVPGVRKAAKYANGPEAYALQCQFKGAGGTVAEGA